MKSFDIWAGLTEDHDSVKPGEMLGTMQAASFREACDQWFATYGDPEGYYNSERGTWWRAKLYPSKASMDADEHYYWEADRLRKLVRSQQEEIEKIRRDFDKNCSANADQNRELMLFLDEKHEEIWELHKALRARTAEAEKEVEIYKKLRQKDWDAKIKIERELREENKVLEERLKESKKHSQENRANLLSTFAGSVLARMERERAVLYLREQITKGGWHNGHRYPVVLEQMAQALEKGKHLLWP